jgi:hypothetical protein
MRISLQAVYQLLVTQLLGRAKAEALTRKLTDMMDITAPTVGRWTFVLALKKAFC